MTLHGSAEYAALHALIDAWDPIGIGPEDLPPAEYDCLVDRLWSLLHRGASEELVAGVLRTELVHHFGLDPDRGDVPELAARIHDRFGS